MDNFLIWSNTDLELRMYVWYSDCSNAVVSDWLVVLSWVIYTNSSYSYSYSYHFLACKCRSCNTNFNFMGHRCSANIDCSEFPCHHELTAQSNASHTFSHCTNSRGHTFLWVTIPALNITPSLQLLGKGWGYWVAVITSFFPVVSKLAWKPSFLKFINLTIEHSM